MMYVLGKLKPAAEVRMRMMEDDGERREIQTLHVDRQKKWSNVDVIVRGVTSSQDGSHIHMLHAHMYPMQGKDTKNSALVSQLTHI